MHKSLRVLGAFLLTFGVVDVTAQEVRVITDEVSCDSCVIERYKIATIHDRAFPEGALMNIANVLLGADGTFLVQGGPMLGELFHANREGAIVRSISREGEGPGEYREVTHVFELPSAFVLFDRQLNRVSRLDKTTFEFLGSTPLPHFSSRVPPLVFEDGSYLFSGSNWTREGAGHFFHLVDQEGRMVRSFGEPDGVVRPADLEFPLVLALSRDGTFWVCYRDRYRIERWDRDGNLLAAIQRDTDWYNRSPSSKGVSVRSAQTRVNRILEDENGLLWVHGRHRPDSDPLTRPNSAEWVSIIEVLDPEAGTLVASSRMENRRGIYAEYGFHELVFLEDSQGLIYFEIWGARLKTYELLNPLGEGGPPGVE